MSAASRRNSSALSTTPSASTSRRNSLTSEDGDFKLNLKKSRPVGTVKITFMGKPMELTVPMQEDVNIYDGTSIEGSYQAKAKNTWVEVFDMIDLTMSNIVAQNKELKRQVNELSSKLNKVLFHSNKENGKIQDSHEEKKETKKDPVSAQVTKEINKKVDSKINKIEENIMMWIDEETTTIKSNIENDITKLREEVDQKNIDVNAKVQATVDSLREEVNEQIAVIDNKVEDTMYNIENNIPIEEGQDLSPNPNRLIIELREKLHRNSNLLRFLISEPLSCQFSINRKEDFHATEDQVGMGQLVPFNRVKCNMGGAVEDDASKLTVDCVRIPISGAYLLSLGGGRVEGLSVRKNDHLKNDREKVLDCGRTDVVQLKEDDTLRVWLNVGHKVKDISFMGVLLRPSQFITPGSTM